MGFLLGISDFGIFCGLKLRLAARMITTLNNLFIPVYPHIFLHNPE